MTTEANLGTTAPKSATSGMRRLAWFLGGLGFLYLLACVLLYAFQRKLLYIPTRVSERWAISEAAKIGFAPWTNAKGEFIGWRRPTLRAGPIMLMVHGNASFALPRRVYAEAMENVGGWNVFLMEYPGYGFRSGTPTRDSLIAAGVEAVEAIAKERPGKVFLLGESMGTGVACAVVEKMPDRIAGLLLTVPFARLADAAAGHYPIFPVKALLVDDFDNVKALEKFRGPLAVMLAGRDEIIPTAHGQRLYISFGGPKKLWIQPHATHNEVDLSPRAEFWKGASDFLREHGLQ